MLLLILLIKNNVIKNYIHTFNYQKVKE